MRLAATAFIPAPKKQLTVTLVERKQFVSLIVRDARTKSCHEDRSWGIQPRSLRLNLTPETPGCSNIEPLPAWRGWASSVFHVFEDKYVHTTHNRESNLSPYVDFVKRQWLVKVARK